MLQLIQLEQTARGLRFRLMICNHSSATLFLPFPDINDLKFGNTRTIEIADWFCSWTDNVDRSVTGFTLNPTESRSFEWQVRPCSIEAPTSMPDGVSHDYDYCRWCVGIEQGEYLVWHQWEVDERFFDCDSWTRLRHLAVDAEDSGASLWTGRVLSNRLRLEIA